MSVVFSTFEFENSTFASVHLELQSPIGTVVISDDVAAGQFQTYQPGVNNANSCSVKVDHGDPQEITLSGTPSNLYIEKLRSRWSNFNLTGSIEAKWLASEEIRNSRKGPRNKTTKKRKAKA